MKVKRTGKVHLYFLLASVMILMFCIAPYTAFAGPSTLTYLTPWPKNAYDSKNFIDYVDEIQKEADAKFPGELKLQFKGGPEVIHTMEQVEGCRKGVITMLLSAPSYYASVMPELDILGLTDMKPWEQRVTGLFDYIDKLHNQKTYWNTYVLV